MKKNVGNNDQIFRIVLGLAIGIVGFVNHSWWGLAGILPVITAITNFCPAYSLFGFSTTKKAKE